MTSTAASITGFLTRPDGRIAYTSAGSGPLVVTSPGMGELRDTYRALTPELVAAGYRVVNLDLRGHGDSDTTFSRYDDEAVADDILAAVDEFGGGRPAVIVGNSMSAAAAVIAASHRPDGVAGLVLTGPLLRNPPLPALVGTAMRALMAVITARPWAASAWKAYLPFLYKGRVPADHAAYLARVAAAMRRPGHATAFSRLSRSLDHDPAERAAPGVRAPVLAFLGELDPDYPTPAAEGEWIAEHLDAEVVMVAESGHYPHAQRPDLVVPATLDFLSRVAPRA